jgi:hypothetical protein
MATGLRLVWSSPPRRAPGSPPRTGSPPSPSVIRARALVDAWVGAPFETGAAALDDLVQRIADALESPELAIATAPALASLGEPTEPR